MKRQTSESVNSGEINPIAQSADKGSGNFLDVVMDGLRLNFFCGGSSVHVLTAAKCNLLLSMNSCVRRLIGFAALVIELPIHPSMYSSIHSFIHSRTAAHVQMHAQMLHEIKVVRSRK